MATEITNLITVSLGKMHKSRQTKCGLNLRKNLLVASVLNKARDVYVSEIKGRSVTQRTAQHAEEPASTPAPGPVRKRRFTSQRSIVDETSSCDVDDDAVSTSKQAKPDVDNSEAISSCAASTTADSHNGITNTVSLVNDVLDQLASDSDIQSAQIDSTTNNDKENSPPSAAVVETASSINQDAVTIATTITATKEEIITTTTSSQPSSMSPTNNTSISSSYGRCLKRRFSRFDAQTDSVISSNDNTSGASATSTDSENNCADKPEDRLTAKRSRVAATDHTVSTNYSSSSTSMSLVTVINSNDPLSMNKLVNMFSQSFPELTTTNNTGSGDNKSSSSSSTAIELNTFAMHLRESIALTA